MANMNYVDHLDLFGVSAKEIPCIKFEGPPTESTVGAVGLFGMDTMTGDVWKCTAVDGGKYTWEPFGTGSPDAVKLTPQTLTEEQKAQARENIGVSSVVVTDQENFDFTIATGQVGYGAGDGALYYYLENGQWSRATTNPCALYVDAGTEIVASFTNYDYYKFSLNEIIAKDEDDIDFYLTDISKSKTFGTGYERIIDTGWQTSDISYTVNNRNIIFFTIARKDNAILTADDYATISELFNVTLKKPSAYVPIAFGAPNSYLMTDSNGNVTAVKSEEDNDIPDYWNDYLDSKRQTLRDKIVSVGANGDAFMYFTDHHTGCFDTAKSNSNNTGHIIDYVRKYTPIRTAIFGGDILNTTGDQSHDQVMQWLWKFREDYIAGRSVFPVIGNHEISTQYNVNGNIISYDEAYATIFKNLEQVTNTNQKLYYCFDNDSQKIRYIVLDTESESFSGNTTQHQWYIDRLTEMEEGWTAVLFAHEFSTTTGYDNPTNPLITQIAGSYNSRSNGASNGISWDFASAKGTVACLVCGHRHFDSSGTNNGILVIHVTTDCGACADNAANDNAAGGNRKAGVITEQAVDVFFINTETKTIETVRLGYGVNRSWTY